MLREHQPGVDLRLTEAEPPEALRMLRAGYVDVALVFRYSPDPPGAAGPPVPGQEAGLGDDESGIDLTEGLREKLLLDEPVHLVTSAQGGADPPAELAGYARHRWIAGCDRCRANLLRQCALAGFTPKIAFTTDDYIAVQALVAADLGVSTLPALCLRAARHPGIRTVPLPGARRYVFAVRYGDPPDPPAVNLLMDVLRTAAVPPPRGSASETGRGSASETGTSGAGSCAGEPAQLQSPERTRAFPLPATSSPSPASSRCPACRRPTGAPGAPGASSRCPAWSFPHRMPRPPAPGPAMTPNSPRWPRSCAGSTGTAR